MSSPTAAAHPVRYAASVETPEADEADAIQALLDTLRKISETTCRDGHHGLRGVDAKSHGLLTGELRVQLCTDLASMPVENASVEWPQAQSPYVSVARIRVPAQLAWSAQRSLAIDDGMAFDPWHALAAQRPLGSIMRARRVAHAAMAKLRAQQNQQPISEPAVLPTPS